MAHERLLHGGVGRNAFIEKNHIGVENQHYDQAQGSRDLLILTRIDFLEPGKRALIRARDFVFNLVEGRLPAFYKRLHLWLVKRDVIEKTAEGRRTETLQRRQVEASIFQRLLDVLRFEQVAHEFV